MLSSLQKAFSSVSKQKPLRKKIKKVCICCRPQQDNTGEPTRRNEYNPNISKTAQRGNAKLCKIDAKKIQNYLTK